MKVTAYYSNTGRSKRIAEYIGSRLNWKVIDLCETSERVFDDLVVVFPVYCQNIPDRVKEFFSRIKAQNVTAVAVYGKMCYGNVLWEIQNKYGINIVAAAYVPTGHVYCNDAEFDRFYELDRLIEKIKNPAPIRVPRSYKNVFSDFFPKTRSRLGVRIRRLKNCDNCGVCERACFEKAIKNGVTNFSCIRCGRCVEVCPKKALRLEYRFFMRLYLRKKKTDRTVLYI